MLPALLALALASTATASPAQSSPPIPTSSPPAWDHGAPAFPGGVAIPALLLAGLGAAAFLITRRRTQRPRLVEVLESQSLGGRRSLVVARLGEELLVLGASEAGIHLLTTAPAPLAARTAAPAPAAAAPAEGRGLGLLSRLRLRPQRAPAPVFDSLLSESLEDLELRRKLAVGQGGSVR